MTQDNTSILNAAREASDIMADIANKNRNKSIFFGNGLVGSGDEIISTGPTSSFVKFVLYALGGEFAETEGATPLKLHNVETATQLVKTSERALAASIDRSLIRRLAGGHRESVINRMRGIVDVWISDVDRRLTTLLEAGESTTDLLGDAFHSAAHTIPGSDQTFLNFRDAVWVTSAATVKSAIVQMIADFEAMRGAHAGLMNEENEVSPVVVMYRGDGSNLIKEKMIDAIDATLLTSTAGTNTLKGLVKHVNNPYLSADTAFYGFMRAGVDSALMYGEVPPGVELITNAGNGNDNADHDQIMNNRDTYKTQYDAAVLVGNPFHSYKRDNG